MKFPKLYIFLVNFPKILNALKEKVSVWLFPTPKKLQRNGTTKIENRHFRILQALKYQENTKLDIRSPDYRISVRYEYLSFEKYFSMQSLNSQSYFLGCCVQR